MAEQNYEKIKSLLNESIEARRNKEQDRLVTKWKDVGLFGGLTKKNAGQLAQLLENQTANFLAESNAITTGGAAGVASGNFVGYATMVFPIVRRFMESLFALDLVGVHALDKAHGLIFYVDYGYGNNVGGDADINLTGTPDQVYKKGDAMLGNPKGSALQGGATAVGGQYDLVGYGYSKVHKTATGIAATTIGAWATGTTWTAAGTVAASADFVGYNARFTDYNDKVADDVASDVLDYTFAIVTVAALQAAIPNVDLSAVDQIGITNFGTIAGAVEWGSNYQGGGGILNLRKQNVRGDWDGARFTPNSFSGTHVLFVIRLSNTGVAPSGVLTLGAALTDGLQVNSDGSSLTLPSFESDLAVSPSPVIPEVDISITSTNVVTTSRKLRTKITPEIAQDAEAYFNFDFEAEVNDVLTRALSTDVQNEILHDLFTQASAARYYWSAAPGRLINKTTGVEVTQATSLSAGPVIFTNQGEWYQTLMKTVNDVGAQIRKKTLMGNANFIVCSTEVGSIIESMNGFKSEFKYDTDGQVSDTIYTGTEMVGTLNRKYRVYTSAHVPSNKILVGYKGPGVSDTGYYYCPYVPVILTDAIPRPEDFAKTKGVMTRYGRKMTRSDCYGTITVLDLNV